MSASVLNYYKVGKKVPDGAIYVGRPSPWGNPFSFKPGTRVTYTNSRIESIDKFREYAKTRLNEEPDWLEPLRGKDLVCWCAPLPCHADVLLELLERV